MKKRFKTKDIILFIVFGIVILAFAVVAIYDWNIIYSLFSEILSGTQIAKEYILSLGFPGILAMSVIIIFCFFFPVISAAPVEIACGVTYGIVRGGLIIVLSVTVASQILYLLKRNAKLFYSEEKRLKQKELEDKIKKSKRGIWFALFVAYAAPCVPFVIIHNVAAAGLPYRKYCFLTVVGPIPDILVTLYLGKALLQTSPVLSVITLIIMITIVALSIVFNEKIVDFIFLTKEQRNNYEKKDAC